MHANAVLVWDRHKFEWHRNDLKPNRIGFIFAARYQLNNMSAPLQRSQRLRVDVRFQPLCLGERRGARSG